MNEETGLAELKERVHSGGATEQARALDILRQMAEDHPDRVATVASEVLDSVDPGADDEVVNAAIRFAKTVSNERSEALQEAVPTLASYLQTDPEHEPELLLTFARIAESNPEEIRPVTRKLRRYIGDASPPLQVSAMAAVGRVAKAYPDVGATTIPTVLDLLAADHDRLRANAAGLLADLAGQYPAELHSEVDRIAHLLSDSNWKTRHNAVEILRRVTQHYPDVGVPTVDLTSLVVDEMPETREKAYVTLGQIQAEQAKEPLERRLEEEPVEGLHETIEWALKRIE